ncbi:MAG: Gfo/Idh/MocA family oxidoreductase [Armatimonadetes bacterium]|nr:Gfo/Idh/MocA family oxidoreductase [Armatimonadota bacterium]
MIKVGVIGTGWWSDRAHLPGLVSVDGIEVAAISDENAQRLSAAGDKFGVARRFEDYRELLDCEDIQAVCIPAPTYRHHAITMDALSKKKHVLCEKSLAMNPAQAREMYEKAQDVGVIHMVPFTWRFVPAAIMMKTLIDQGYLGRVFHIEARYLAGWLSDPSVPASWRMRREFAGTGALGDTGSHLIDFIRWTVGEFEGVVADSRIFIKDRIDGATGKPVEVDVDDSTMFLGRLVNGAQAVVHCSRVATSRENYIDVEISGTDGTLIFQLEVEGEDWVVGKLYGSQKPDVKPQPLPISDTLLEDYEVAKSNVTGKFLFARIMQAFKAGIESGKEPSPNFHDGMRVQQVMQAVEDSALKRQWTRV